MTTREQLIEMANQADVNRAMAGFLRAHRKERLSSCEANQDLLLSTIGQLVLDPTDPSSYEIAYLKLKGNLVIDEEEPKPKPVPLEPVTPLKDQTPDRSWPTEKIRTYLKEQGTASEAVVSKPVLPKTITLRNALGQEKTVELTPTNLKKLEGTVFRNLMEKYGTQAVNDRLAGRS